jgi:LysR family glycine cleavage system transcriptional activator
MSDPCYDKLRQVPSLRSLYIFGAACRHLNLIRAADELGLTQGALSRQIRSLEEHLGLQLFVRTPRGLKLTETGDILRAHCEKAFGELQQGLASISSVKTRQTLLIACARSYACRVLSHHIGDFAGKYPWVELILDGHRHLADLVKNEADAAIRVGDGQWAEVIAEKIQDDPLFPVAAPVLLRSIGTDDIRELLKASATLHFSERAYWQQWSREAGIDLPNTQPRIRFSETTMMLEAAEAGQGIAIARRSLVTEAIATNRLVPVSKIRVDDGIGYYFCATHDALRKDTVRKFRNWLFSAIPRADAIAQADQN